MKKPSFDVRITFTNQHGMRTAGYIAEKPAEVESREEAREIFEGILERIAGQALGYIVLFPRTNPTASTTTNQIIVRAATMEQSTVAMELHFFPGVTDDGFLPLGTSTSYARRGDLEFRVRKIISEQLGCPVDQLSDEQHLVSNLGADSLDIVELKMALEDEFGLELNDSEVDKLETVGEVINFIIDRNSL